MQTQTPEKKLILGVTCHALHVHLSLEHIDVETDMGSRTRKGSDGSTLTFETV